MADHQSRLTYCLYLALSAGFVALDQVTKMYALMALSGSPPVTILPVLEWSLAFNQGAAFGFLADAGGAQIYFLSALALIVSVVLLVWLWRVFADNRLVAWGIAFILAGAVGNLIDRLRLGYVIDFISVHYRHWYFPTFNVADACITFGVLLMLVDTLGVGRNQGTSD